jgi:ABC-type branched-subunit amino acid transport system substrate-binding protein
MFKPVQFLFAAVFALALSGCVTGGTYSGNMPGNTGVVTNDPNAMPNLGWQTAGDRRDLAQQSAAASRDPNRPGLVVSAKKVKVAILLPLSGKNADLGQSMLKAAQMALFDVGSANFEMVPKDTKSTTAGASLAAQEAANSGASMFLGPIFAEDVRAVKPVSAAHNIPMLAFTTDWTLGGGDTYIMGFLPFAQVARVAQYAKTHGGDRVAVFAPTTPYCDAVIGTLNRAGVNPVKVQRYSPQQADLNSAVAAFAQQNKVSTAPLSYTFNALMMPVGGESMRSLASVLSANGINNRNTRFLGTGLWDDTALAGDPAVYGGWFAAPDPASRRDFERRYSENYGGAPLRLSSLAYDATALAAVLARTGGDGNPYSRDRLMNQRGFAGIDGIFRFRGDGLSERGLAVLEIRSGGARVIDPAPTAFLGSGS